MIVREASPEASRVEVLASVPNQAEVASSLEDTSDDTVTLLKDYHDGRASDWLY